MFFIHKRFRMLYNMHMKIGIYGGTFDPVHMGHIFVARSVKQELGLDRVDLLLRQIRRISIPQSALRLH